MEENTTERKYTYKLDANDFRKLFLASDEDFEKISEGYGFISRRNSQTVLKNVTIIGNIPIRNIVSNNCTPILFDHVKIENIIIARSDLSYLDGKHKTRFNFQGCEIEGIYINAGTSIGDITIRQSEVKESIEICEGKVDYIEIESSRINDVQINFGSSAKSFLINESISGKINFYNSQVDSIKIEDSSTSAISIFESQIKENFKIEFSGIGYFTSHKSSINNFNIEGSHSGNFHFSDTTMYAFEATAVDCSYSIDSSRITILKLLACKIPTLSIGLSCEIEAYITGGWINKIDFSNITLRNGTIISFVDVKVYSIIMDALTVLGNVYFRNIKIVKNPFPWYSVVGVSISDKAELRKDILADLDKKSQEREKEYQSECERLKENFEKPTLKIANSSLGKTEFTGCPLHQYTFIYINSKISECFVSGGSIPSENILIEGYTDKDPEWYQHKILFFNQFVKIFEAQGDLYHISQFQAIWSEEQRQELKLRHKNEFLEKGLNTWSRSGILRKFFKNLSNPFLNFQKWMQETKLMKRLKVSFNTTSNDLCILWLNRISNLYGESWLKPIGVFFLLVIPIIYLFYLYFIDRLFISSGFDKNLIWKYLEFINPTHSMKFVDENKKVEGIAILFDFIGRILSAYGIYQFIAAFRKHTKKQ